HKKLVGLLLVMACGVVVFPPAGRCEKPARAGGSAKVAPDLRQRLHGGPGRNRQKVIIQLDEAASPPVDALVPGSGGVGMRELHTLGMRALDLPSGAVEALAAHSEVRYISPDRELNSFGHIESTTGTAAIRTQTTTSLGNITTTTVYDGQGIGIAILDSGID